MPVRNRRFEASPKSHFAVRILILLLSFSVGISFGPLSHNWVSSPCLRSSRRWFQFEQLFTTTTPTTGSTAITTSKLLSSFRSSSLLLATVDGEDSIGTNSPASDTRRRVLLETTAATAGLSLAALLSSSPFASAAHATVVASSEPSPKTIVITGANSGVGFEASKRLAAEGHTLVLACRTLDKAEMTVARIREQLSGSFHSGLAGSTWAPAKLVPAECNLASLASIKNFASDFLPSRIGGRGDGREGIEDSSPLIDALCLNAGLSRNTAATDCLRTDDGFEVTVGVNHFGHFYLNHLLLPYMSPSGKIVVTSSSVHDPDGPGGAQGMTASLGNLEGLQTKGRACEMIDGGDFNADKAYKDSKLCNVLFTRELQRRLERKATTKGITANSFTPGLIVGTGLFRDQNPFFVKLFDFAATDLFKVGETPSWGGGCLAYMVDSVNSRGLFYAAQPGASKDGDAAFGNQFKSSPVSKEAQDDQKAKKLWELSERVLGLA